MERSSSSLEYLDTFIILRPMPTSSRYNRPFIEWNLLGDITPDPSGNKSSSYPKSSATCQTSVSGFHVSVWMRTIILYLQATRSTLDVLQVLVYKTLMKETSLDV